MQLSWIDTTLWVASITGELLLVWVLISRGLYKVFPVFTAYVAWLTLSDPLLFLVLYWQHNVSSVLYYRTYFSFNCIEYAIELAVLFEIAANVLQPAKRLFRKNILIALAVCIVVGALGAFIFAAQLNAATLSHQRTFLGH